MLSHDEGEERKLQGIGLELKDPEQILAAVGIVGSEDDETTVGKAGSEGLIGAEAATLFFDDKVRPALL